MVPLLDVCQIAIEKGS
jgi:hypothetical protein